MSYLLEVCLIALTFSSREYAFDYRAVRDLREFALAKGNQCRSTGDPQRHHCLMRTGRMH